MIRINLLPHREEKRKARQQQFAVLAGITFALGALFVWAGHIVITDKVDYQNARNQFLNNQIAILDKQIEEIRQIKSKTKELLVRKNVVETLQTSRTEVVHLLDQLVRLLPDGVYLQSVKQEGYKVNLVGYAQSNAWVSTLMRNLESSPWLETPLLIEIKAVTLNDARLNEFSLDIKLTHSPDNDDTVLLANKAEGTEG